MQKQILMNNNHTDVGLLKKITKVSVAYHSSFKGIGRLLCIAMALLTLPFYATAQQTNITVGGTSRSMFVYAPSGLAQNRPLVISLHGLNQDINYQKNQAKWELVADTAKFVVVYPAGVNNSWDISGNRDTDFISAIIDNMATRYGIDRNRVYVSGFSMGGMMSYHTANRIADKVAAIGPVSGYLFGNVTASSRPMPIIHVHGTTDDVVYYQASGNQQGVVAMLQKWRTWNKCPSTGTRITPYPANRPNSRSVMEYWGPCDNSAVALVTLDGKGHWHSNDDAGVHTTRELWNFLKNHSLNGGGLPVVNITAPANNSTFTAPASINITATASDPNGSVTKVEFFNGTTKLGEDVTAPYTYQWSNVVEGTYTLTAKATDNSGNVSTSTAISIRVSVPQGPYGGTPRTIPGRIEAEHYDVGGQGVAYNEANTNGNEGGATLRNDEVDIEVTQDVTGSHNVGYILNGEWLEYTVNVTQAGVYTLDLRMAADGTGKTLHVEMDGVNITGPITVPNTAGWQIWQTVTVSNLSLTAGQKVMRIAFDSDYMNLNYVEFKGVVTSTEDTELASVSFYPNPFHSDGLQINSEGNVNYKILDLTGQIIEQGNFQGQARIGSGLKSGTYMLSIENQGNTLLRKVTKN